MTRTKLFIVMLIVSVFLGGCAAPKKAIRSFYQGDQKPASLNPQTPPIVPFSPRLIEAELRVVISNIHLLKGKALADDNRKRGIPPQTPPQLHLWASAIIPRLNQHVPDLKLIGPAPQDIFADKENGNRIFYWNLTPYLEKQDSIVISRRVKIESYALLGIIDSTAVLSYDTSGAVFRFYTKSEPFLELTPDIRAAAAGIVGDETNPYKKTRMIFDWVHRKMTYIYPPAKRGAPAALASLKGDCGQYADLFIALCRAAGVPARFVGGFQAQKKPKLSFHAWAEFYLPGMGWLPADATHDRSQFARLNNRRLIVSVGSNIFLKHAPSWATYSNSDLEDSRTDIMQVATVAYAGIRVKIKTGIRTIRFDKASF
ncbi:transglutaminase-like superfamily protein [bacterium BMS3Abin05]|nr:transglutaminase-like superfamily protein [bacterium BMS3Abin05]GBE28810.1 transglutaminase-like superfamily protein [bacterium BMS3Bbin03]HDL78513.1 transglutaminase domain-containing protein [Bacteroidota bacterium]